MANNIVIHGLLKEVRQDQKEANKRSQDFREKMLTYHAECNNRLDYYNGQLEIHIDGVKTLKELHTDNVIRIEKLEEPNRVIKFLRVKVVKIAGYIITIIGAITALITLVRSL